MRTRSDTSSIPRFFSRSLMTTGAVLAATVLTTPASAQGRYGNGSYGGSSVLHWRGQVDDVEDIRLQGNRVETRTVSGGGASRVRSQISGGLPASDVTVRVNDRSSGRGRVVVVQQPHAWNGYTAVVRVEDRQAGPGWYDFDLTW